jgi:hypothetical protein
MWVVHRQGQGWAVTDALALQFAQPGADKSQDVVLRSMDYRDGKPPGIRSALTAGSPI